MTSLEAKIVVLGSQGVGKTSLVQRYVKNQFLSSSTTSTVGASFLTKRVVDAESDTIVRLQIWDTAGQERFRSISRLYYRGANACILCYSITDQKSFEEMGVWLGELRKEMGKDVILHVVGTKADLRGGEREVPFERCIAYVAENVTRGAAGGSSPPMTAGGLGFGMMDGTRSPGSKRSSGFWGMEVGWDCCHEVSAESGEGVDEVFRVVTRKLVEQNGRKELEALGLGVGSPGMGLSPGGAEGEGYFDGKHGGSFRVGRDRRSWLGFPSAGLGAQEVLVDAEVGEEAVKRGRCC